MLLVDNYIGPCDQCKHPRFFRVKDDGAIDFSYVMECSSCGAEGFELKGIAKAVWAIYADEWQKQVSG
ncbi:MAG: hypothetical protein KC422_25295 [Trueperaceae bacterium]|nr:hypothetical protein [Trueperaceae bacterium]